MWSKVGRLVEGLHVVGVILTKISVNCVINLHVAMLFTCYFLWVYPMRGYSCMYSYGYCMYMFPVYVACICLLLFQCESMHLHMYLVVYVIYIYIYIYVSARVFCVYILIACNSKNLCGITQLDVGYVTVCSVERIKVFSGIACLDMCGQECYT